MKSEKRYKEIIEPQNQLNLFGYENYFNAFIELYEKKKLPNTILLSGEKGLGKSTFVYHFINYVLSKNEKFNYSTNNFSINEKNYSYKLLNKNTHPNFFLIENRNLEKGIKIDQARNLLRFLNKSTYSRDLKLIMIDNAEYLNLNSSNALLKAIEEPRDNTFFFIICNDSSKILSTVKSRCTEFRFFFNTSQKKDIFQNLIEQYDNKFVIDTILKKLYFVSPGNLLKYILPLYSANSEAQHNNLSCILYFIDKYKNEKKPEIISLISLFIEIFYNELTLSNSIYVNTYYLNNIKILKQIDDMKKFNLDEKNIFIWIKDILANEAK